MKLKILVILIVTISLFGITGTVLASNFMDSQNSAVIEATEAVNLKDIAAIIDIHSDSSSSSSHNKRLYEATCNHLSKTTEKDFANIEGIEAADADVNYDEALEQYSIKLSLTSDSEIDEEQVENYKNILNKTFGKVILKINGTVM